MYGWCGLARATITYCIVGVFQGRKLFANFMVSGLTTKVFSAKYWGQGIVYWEESGAAQKFSLRNLQLSQFAKVFSLDMVFSPSIWYLPPTKH